MPIRTLDTLTSEVTVHVYSLHPLNEYLGTLGLGAYHTGIEVNGQEWTYGYTEGVRSGVFSLEPRIFPEGDYITSISLGISILSRSEIDRIINRFRTEWCGVYYHPLGPNCNTFSRALAYALLGVDPIPGWVDRLARWFGFLKPLVPSGHQRDFIQASHQPLP